MAGKRGNLPGAPRDLSAGQAPQQDVSVFAAAGQLPAVPAELDVEDRVMRVVPNKRRSVRRGVIGIRDVPDLDDSVTADAGQFGSVRVVGEAFHVIRVTD